MIFANQYLVTVRDESQQITKRLVSASNSENAISLLKKQNLRVISMETRPNAFWEALKQGRLEIGQAASNRELATFSVNLSLMGLAIPNSAGMPNACQTTASVTRCSTPQPAAAGEMTFVPLGGHWFPSFRFFL